MSISLYYMKGDNNFGDILSKYIVKSITNRNVKHAKAYTADLISTGSLLSKVERTRFKRAILRPHKPIHIWGTGINCDGPMLSSRGLKIHALRGRLSQSRFGLNREDCAIGDPALLCSKLFPVKRNGKRGKTIIAPHLNDFRFAAWLEKIGRLLGFDYEIVDLSDNVFSIINKIASARNVITSAMHPLIVSHSYDVPVIWVDVGHPTVIGGNYKFKDYYSAFDLPCQCIKKKELLNDRVSVNYIEDMFQESHIERDKLKLVQDDLLSSFPQEFCI